jgi:GNAT superfamily N-acetyltransferase
MVIIRPATMADKARILELGAHFLRTAPYNRYLEPDDEALERFFDLIIGLGDERGAILVAETDWGGIFGMLAIVAVPHPMTGAVYADEIAWWVEPGNRGDLRGGPRLLKAAEEWSLARGLKMIKMIAPAGTDVGAFYERLGYVPIETVWGKILPGD